MSNRRKMNGGNGNGNENCKDNSEKNEKKNGNGKKILEDSAEFLIIALLLSGDLQLDSILIDREGEIEIVLAGKIKKVNEDNAKKMADFLMENGSMTFNDALEGLRRYMNNG